jgi:hypothetical protein
VRVRVAEARCWVLRDRTHREVLPTGGVWWWGWLLGGAQEPLSLLCLRVREGWGLLCAWTVPRRTAPAASVMGVGWWRRRVSGSGPAVA